MILEYAQTVDELAEKVGILPEFETDGIVYHTSFETKKALLEALGYSVDSPQSVKKELQTILEKPFKKALPPVLVVSCEEKNVDVPVCIKASETPETLKYEIVFEDGEKLSGEKNTSELPVLEKKIISQKIYEQRILTLSVPALLGYHTLKVSGDSVVKQGQSMSLIVTPEKCYMPEMMRQGGKPWGFPVQLYALRSEHNWGIGDFSDLKEMTAAAKTLGADIVGINPINVSFMAKPEIASPYYSSCRMFLNPLYIDVMAVEEAKDCQDLQEYVSSKSFKTALKKARDAALVDYTAVAKLKIKAFEILFADFKKASADRRKAFEEFCEKGGKDLQNAALYQVLADFFVKKKKNVGFKSWGEKYASPDTKESIAFAKENVDKINYYKYLFWLADEQFQKVSDESERQGLGIGLYQDLAVGVASESAETWGAQDLFVTELSIGSPPDMFNANGQKWGVAPMRPDVMREEAYASYRRILSANMKRAGAVRIDHVMGLVRLYCMPDGGDGAYIRYNVNDLIGIVALESHRNKCLVVGEDLGVVPDFFREILEKAGILSFRIFRYEQTEEGCYKPLSSYPRTALIASGTHDMPTLLGYWLETDLETAKQIGLIDDEKKADVHKFRYKERFSMMEGLARTGRWFINQERYDEELDGQFLPDRLIEEVYSYLATAPCCLLLVQLEDLLEQKEQMNMPGTSNEYPNWRWKLTKTVAELCEDEDMKRICATIRRNRMQ